MKCTLMHKRIAVAEMELDDATGLIQKIGVVYVPEHLPVGIAVKNGAADRASGGPTGRSRPADPVSGRRWKHWRSPAPKCSWSAAMA